MEDKQGRDKNHRGYHLFYVTFGAATIRGQHLFLWDTYKPSKIQKAGKENKQTNKQTTTKRLKWA